MQVKHTNGKGLISIGCSIRINASVGKGLIAVPKNLGTAMWVVVVVVVVVGTDHHQAARDSGC